MLNCIKEIKLDMSGGNSCVCVTAKQSDKKTRYIKITLYENGKAFDFPEDVVARLRAEKPDGNSVLNDEVINEDKSITVELTEQILAVSGTVKAEISLYSLDGSVLTSCTFYINVISKAFSEEQIESSYEANALNNALNKADISISIAEQAAEAAAQAAKNAENAALTAQNTAIDIALRLENGEFNGKDGENGYTNWMWLEVYPDNNVPNDFTMETQIKALRNEIYVEQYQNLAPDFFFFCASDGMYLGTERKKGDVLKVHVDENARYDIVEYFVSLQGEQGEPGEKGDSYILSEQDKQDIAGLIDPPKWKKVYEVTTTEEVTQILKSGLNLSQAFVRVQGVATSSNDEITNTSISFYVITDIGQSVAGQISSAYSAYNKTANNVNYLTVKAMGELIQTEASYKASTASVVKSASNGANVVKGTVIKSIFISQFMGAVLGAGTTFEIWGIEA